MYMRSSTVVTRRIVIVLSLLGPFVASAVARGEGPPPAAPQSRKVDIGGGRGLSLLTQGVGAPTVVIEAGMGSAPVESGEWKAVCDELAKTNRVCVYDRAGLGASDPAPKLPRTARDVARDLHALLVAAQVPGPYVMVGHSIGGLNVLAFADLYPHDVAGVVLVDSTHPDQDSKWLAALGDAQPGEDAAVTSAREFLKARLARPGENPEKLDILASGAQVRSARSLGDRPLAVVTHSPDWKMVPGLPDDVSKKLEEVTQGLQKRMAQLSTDSSQRVAKHAGHHVHHDEPELVVAAVREVVDKVARAR
jgi:pimeloyl-ACP methyl ester carboxylesterase